MLLKMVTIKDFFPQTEYPANRGVSFPIFRPGEKSVSLGNAKQRNTLLAGYKLKIQNRLVQQNM